VQALDVGAAVSPSGIWTPYLALEWLEGAPLDVDLRDRAHRGLPGRSLAEAVTLLDSAARAIALAHEQGVAHRDLKPSNLFVADIGGKRVCKVVDFGIAKVMSDVSNLTRALQETGVAIQAFTPLYGAPEQFDRKYGATGPWTDVFAFALVLVEVMSGRPALDGGDTTQLFVSSMRPDRRPTPRACGVRVSDNVEQVFAHALAVDPKTRFMSLNPFWQALVAEAPRAPVVDAFARTAYSDAPPPNVPLGLAPTGLAPTTSGSTGLPAPGRMPTGLAPTGLAPTVGPSTTMPQVSSLPPLSPAAYTAHAGPPRASRTWIGVLAAAAVVVAGLVLVIVILVLRLSGTRRSALGPTLPGLPGGGGSADMLRGVAAQKVTRKDPTCLKDLEAADRMDPAGGAAPMQEPIRAFCEMLAGKCEDGRKRYRAYLLQTNPAMPDTSLDAAVNVIGAQYCPRDKLTPEERAASLMNDVNTALQKGDTNQCIVLGNELVASADSLPDRTGAQQAARMQVTSALMNATKCAAKGGRCDDAHNFFRAYMRLATKQPVSPAANDAAFRNMYPECARK
jgi:serine/threonine-protein kinase